MAPNRKAKTGVAGPSIGSGRDTDGTAIKTRVESIDWTKVCADLDTQGWSVVPKLLTQVEADSIVCLYPQEQGFRSRVVMARHSFGQGEYKYFSYPLPPLIQTLRTAAYPHLVPIANQWHERTRKEERFPSDHTAFLERCHEAG
jgi:uncharacterized protein